MKTMSAIEATFVGGGEAGDNFGKGVEEALSDTGGQIMDRMMETARNTPFSQSLLGQVVEYVSNAISSGASNFGQNANLGNGGYKGFDGLGSAGDGVVPGDAVAGA
jgi:hypothetical protein